MVDEQIRRRGVAREDVLAALRRVPRHVFVPEEYLDLAYDDRPLPIGRDQTISQPYMVGYMTEALEVARGDRVLEIGLGSGYQAAVLCELGAEVHSIEILPELARRSTRILEEQGYEAVHVRIGDGRGGWPEAAPFDGIIATAAPAEVPQPLLDQLAPGGRMVIPVGGSMQELRRVRRSADGTRFEQEVLMGVRFVPMTGGDPEPPGKGADPGSPGESADPQLPRMGTDPDPPRP
ncbi:MAG: protein-L-isoaspartate(D-aspartate) O-methyltransferase [Gemmatimonadetes bacterium]|nr:protein-L-isoaspartate(D-aspartate) O-methyltransferase [Gemmatimonadota bacterium]